MTTLKISISFPPLESVKGVPLLTQNRQFQWFASPTYIYPVIPAYAASLLKEKGYEIFWDDAIAEKLSHSEWKERIIKEAPDLIVIETKTPVIERHWKIINELKVESHKVKSWKPKIVLAGDHATALPEESLQKCQADFIIQGGDFDFILLSLADKLSGKKEWEGGIWYRDGSKIKNSGSCDLNKHSLEELPLIDRELTKWRLYAYENGNFKHTPGSYMMSGRDCWWGKCSFCSWTTLFPGKNFRVMPPAKALAEVENLIKLGIKEIMEDSGSLPVGQWLEEFCQGMIDRGYNKKVTMSCNMRINGIKDVNVWKLMKKAGFRFVLFGLESANQITLDNINKNLRVEEIEPNLKKCKEAGLEPHITAMIGYPWETKEMAEKTVNLAKQLFKKGYVDTLQATIMIPYPGTPLYKYCRENNLLRFTDYSRFDQREQVMVSPLSNEDVKELVQSLYKSFLSPQFILKKIISVRNWEDVKFLFRASQKLIGHLADFKNK